MRANVNIDRNTAISSRFWFICAYTRTQHCTDAPVAHVAPVDPTDGTGYDDIVTFNQYKIDGYGFISLNSPTYTLISKTNPHAVPWIACIRGLYASA